MLPRYTHKEDSARRQGRNIFESPAAPPYGLDQDGFLDFFQVTSLPISYLRPRDHRCNFSAATFDALIAAFREFLLP